MDVYPGKSGKILVSLFVSVTHEVLMSFSFMSW